MNTVNLIGRTTAQPELRNTQSGTSVTSFTLAVDRRDKEKSTDFIPCVAWQKTAEIINSYVTKGQLIGVSGRLQFRSYKDKEGKNRTSAEVIVDNFDFCERKSETAQPKQQENDFKEIDEDDGLLPFK